jgi:hypothetical protein
MYVYIMHGVIYLTCGVLHDDDMAHLKHSFSIRHTRNHEKFYVINLAICMSCSTTAWESNLE